jgi:hypothetical protein
VHQGWGSSTNAFLRLQLDQNDALSTRQRRFRRKAPSTLTSIALHENRVYQIVEMLRKIGASETNPAPCSEYLTTFNAL